jgi:hypothetical protein
MEILIAVSIGAFCVLLDKILDGVIAWYRHRRATTFTHKDNLEQD